MKATKKEENKTIKKGTEMMYKSIKTFAEGLDLKMSQEGIKNYENFKLIPQYRNAVTAQHIFQYLASLPRFENTEETRKSFPVVTLWKASDNTLQYLHNLNGSPIDCVLFLKPIIMGMVEHIRKTEAYVRNEEEQARLSKARQYKKTKQKKGKK